MRTAAGFAPRQLRCSKSAGAACSALLLAIARTTATARSDVGIAGQDSVLLVTLIEDLPGRIEASFIGALAGEHAAGTAAGTADLVGVAESAAACGGFDDADLRQRGLERPSRAGAAGLLLRALPFGLLSPLDRPRLRRDAYRCVAMAGADEGTAVSAVAAALLIADLLRFDLETSLVRVRQSLLEDAPMALLDRLRVVDGGPPMDVSDPTRDSPSSARSVRSPPRTRSTTSSRQRRAEPRWRPASRALSSAPGTVWRRCRGWIAITFRTPTVR